MAKHKGKHKGGKSTPSAASAAMNWAASGMAGARQQSAGTTTAVAPPAAPAGTAASGPHQSPTAAPRPTPQPRAGRTLEQRRATYALAAVQRHVGNAGAERYGTLVRSLPAMVLMNGIGQALAYLRADAGGNAGKPSAQLAQELEDWLCGPPDTEHPERVYSTGPLLTALMAGERHQYQQAQRSSLLVLGWVKKFADAYGI